MFQTNAKVIMTPTIDTLLDELLAREGSKDTNDPNDSGGRTKFGISQKWHPDAWAEGPPTRAEAKEIFFTIYIMQPKIYLVQPEFLMGQLVDYAVLSSPRRAIIALQHILQVVEDGVLGPITLGAITRRDPRKVNNAIVDRRVLLMTRLVQQRPKDLVWLYGWVSRALKFRV